MVVNIFSFHIFVTNGLPHIINFSSAHFIYNCAILLLMNYKWAIIHL